MALSDHIIITSGPTYIPAYIRTFIRTGGRTDGQYIFHFAPKKNVSDIWTNEYTKYRSLYDQYKYQMLFMGHPGLDIMMKTIRDIIDEQSLSLYLCLSLSPSVQD